MMGGEKTKKLDKWITVFREVILSILIKPMVCSAREYPHS